MNVHKNQFVMQSMIPSLPSCIPLMPAYTCEYDARDLINEITQYNFTYAYWMIGSVLLNNMFELFFTVFQLHK